MFFGLTCFAVLFVLAIFVGVFSEVLERVPAERVLHLPVHREIKANILSAKAELVHRGVASQVWKVFIPSLVTIAIGYVFIWVAWAVLS